MHGFWVVHCSWRFEAGTGSYVGVSGGGGFAAVCPISSGVLYLRDEGYITKCSCVTPGFYCQGSSMVSRFRGMRDAVDAPLCHYWSAISVDDVVARAVRELVRQDAERSMLFHLRAESAVRGDGTSEEEVEAVSRQDAPTAPQAKVGRDADDADVAGVAARDELGEHPDLARGAVVDRGAVEPATRPFDERRPSASVRRPCPP